MTVKLILDDKGRDVLSVAASATLGDVVKILAERRIGAVVVVDANKRVEGIVSERDVVRTVAKGGDAWRAMPVEQAMTRAVVTCIETDTVDHIMAKMTEGRFRHVPVVNAGLLVGLISIGDVVKRRIAQVEQERRELQDYIMTA